MNELLLLSNAVSLVPQGQVISCLFLYGQRPVYTKVLVESQEPMQQDEYIAVLEESARYALCTLAQVFKYKG